ncbi:TadE-like [Burkholderiales bacterium]
MTRVQGSGRTTLTEWLRLRTTLEFSDARVCKATRPWDRFWGLLRFRRCTALVFPACNSIHRWLPTGPFDFAFFDSEGCLIREGRSRPLGVYRESTASMVVEVPHQKPCHAAARPSGASMVEGLLVLPVLLLLALGLVQLLLIGLASLVIQYAASEGARQGAVEGGRASAIDRGIARGLAPLWFDSNTLVRNVTGAGLAIVESMPRYLIAKGQGQVSWSMISPVRDAFEDWSDPKTGAILPPAWVQPSTLQPRSGSAAVVGGLPVGRRSGLHYIDAASIKIHVSVGVPLIVPLAGPVMAKTLRLVHACGAADLRRECLLLSGRGGFGRSIPMIGIRATGIGVAQSALHSEMVGR